MIDLTIYGQTPSKKNSKQLFMRGGKPTMISSSAYREWEHDALVQLIGKPKQYAYPAHIYCTFYVKDKRARDLDNMLSSVLDTLVKSRILVEDNFIAISKMVASYGGIDKVHPRVEIQITSHHADDE